MCTKTIDSKSHAIKASKIYYYKFLLKKKKTKTENNTKIYLKKYHSVNAAYYTVPINNYNIIILKYLHD